jgi:hypothetical protein
MAISISQYIDLLVKKLDGVAKTDTATNKSPSNESIPSPELNRGDTCWTQANAIPAIATATANLVAAYQNGNAVRTTADNTTVQVGGIYPTWLTGQTGWIPPEFGSTYSVQAYVGPPGAGNIVATGTLIPAAGSGGNYQWFFDYEAGLLNFIGETIPPSLTSGNVVYVTGYQYVGLQGVTHLPSGTNIGNLTISGNTITGNLVTVSGNVGMVIPAGNTAQRPNPGITGTIRINTEIGQIEGWDGNAWVAGNGTPITNQTFNGDSVSNTFSLNTTTTTAAALVMLNGVVQVPTTAYSVVPSPGNTLVFTQAPAISDVIDVRFLR